MLRVINRLLPPWLAMFPLTLLLVPACRLSIGTGEGGWGGDISHGDGGAAGDGGSGGYTGESADGGMSPGEEAAFQATLDQADELELARAQVRSETAAYLFGGLVEQNIDPAILESGDAQLVEDTVQALIDTYGGDIWTQAEEWANSLDPAELLASFPVNKQPKCLTTHNCPTDLLCRWDFGTGLKDIPCAVTGCGEGKCSWCPDIFPDLGGLIVKSWCSYTCVKDWQHIVGIKIRINLALNGNLEGCYKFSKPIPCDGGSECFPNKP